MLGFLYLDGGQLEEIEEYTYFFVIFYVRIEIDQLLCVIIFSNRSQFVGQL